MYKEYLYLRAIKTSNSSFSPLPSTFPVFSRTKASRRGFEPRVIKALVGQDAFLGGCLVSFHSALIRHIISLVRFGVVSCVIPRSFALILTGEKGDAALSKVIKVFFHRKPRCFDPRISAPPLGYPLSIILLVDTSARNLLLSNELRAY